MNSRILLVFLALLPPLAPAVEPVPPEPTRIVIECEDMQGVAQDKFGPGPGWQVGRWGEDLYQNMIFGGAWASRLRTAMTDAGDNPAAMTAEFETPSDGAYKVWVKYECPPFFNYAFGVRIESLNAKAAVFEKTYGLREAAKHFSFKYKELTAGDLYWSWGIDHDAAEGYPVTLAKGRYRLILSKTKNPEPAGTRSLDAVLITSDLSDLSAPRFARYPLLDELRRANHVYFRFRNPAGARQPVLFAWNHWNHRQPDYHPAGYRERVRFYDEKGNPLEGGKNGDWTNATAPGAASPWYDLGPTMNTDSTSPFRFLAFTNGAAVEPGKHGPRLQTPSQPFAVDIALKPDEKAIVRSFAIEPGEAALAVLVQPDLRRPEGVANTKKATDLFVELIRELNKEPRLGPLPKKLRLFGDTCSPYATFIDASTLETAMAFREALGLNTVHSYSPQMAPAAAAWGKRRGGFVERSLMFFYAQNVTGVVASIRERKLENQAYCLSFGDEIGLPAVNGNDTNTVEAFHAFLRKRGETPQSLGLAGWEQVKPLAALSADVAVQIGVLPEAKKADAAGLEGLKRLYWHSAAFRTEQGIALFAEKTRTLKATLGDAVHASANLGGMHPFYWMNQASFIEAFKGKAMSLAWSEDYTYCQPEASRLVAEFQAAYLRKGASYHDTPMMFYCMPHWPGNNPGQLLQNAVLEWGQNVKDLDFFCVGPDIWFTENYIAARGGLSMFRMVRTISGMAGLLEDHLLPARPEPARIAMLLSEASDVWETEGKGQGAVQPGSVASNVSQEERKAIWYALRYAGHRVDHITEKDCADGLLNKYSVLYVCGQNLERAAAVAVKEWVKAGGVLFATAGAARKDEFDAPLTDLDEMLGRGKAVSDERYKGPLRARLELLFVKALDEVRLKDGMAFTAYCSREEFAADSKAQVLGTYKDGKPAFIANEFGKSRAYYTGTLPGQAWVKAALPVLPQGKGGPNTAAHMIEWQDWNPVASSVIRTPLQAAGVVPDVAVNQGGVITSRLKSDRSTVITVVNLAFDTKGALKDVVLRVSGGKPVKRAWSCFHSKGNLLKGVDNGVAVVELPTLGPADVVVLEN
jgi:hypothetical protein